MYYKDEENLKKQMNDLKNSVLSIVVVIFSISFSLMGSDIIVSTKGSKVYEAQDWLFSALSPTALTKRLSGGVKRGLDE